jgi:hypothetical protein
VNAYSSNTKHTFLPATTADPFGTPRKAHRNESNRKNNLDIPTMTAIGLAINGVPELHFRRFRFYTIQKIVVFCMCIARMHGTKELLDNCF